MEQGGPTDREDQNGRITHLFAEAVDAPFTYEYLQVETKHSLQ
jgi:hypothetical protein